MRCSTRRVSAVAEHVLLLLLKVCIYMYIIRIVCTCVHIYVYVYIYICLNVYICTCIHICIYIYINIDTPLAEHVLLLVYTKPTSAPFSSHFLWGCLAEKKTFLKKGKLRALVYRPSDAGEGWGNRLLSLSSSFVLALTTRRVFLVHNIYVYVAEYVYMYIVAYT